MTLSQADHRLRKTVRQLTRYIPENIVIDIPALRKILGIQPFHFTGRYTKLSELLRDMPSDEVLFQLDRERGNLTGAEKGIVSAIRTCISCNSGCRPHLSEYWRGTWYVSQSSPSPDIADQSWIKMVFSC